MKRYPKYKDSGVEWIGEIPENWTIVRNKEIFKERKERANEIDDYDLLAVSEYYGVDKKINTINDGDYLTRANSLEGYKICKKNDLAMNIMLAWKGAYGFSEYTGIVSPSYAVFSAMNIHVRYYHYLLRTNQYSGLFGSFSTGVIDSRLRLYPNIFLGLYSHKPPIKEQKRIADYLDRKTQAIDDLITDKEKLIELLKEKRKEIISRAVTKGLDPNAPMKDSGVDWIGEIPEEWKVAKVGYYYNSQLGKMLQPNQMNENDTLERYLCAANIQKNGISEEPFKEMWFSTKDKEIYEVTCGDLLVVEGGDVGLSAIYESDKTTYIQNALHRIRGLNNSSVEFLHYWLIYLKDRGYMDLVCNKATIAHFTKEKLINTLVVLPSIRVQNDVVCNIDSKTFKIDKVMDELLLQIEKFKEYRQAIISEAVTGKVVV